MKTGSVRLSKDVIPLRYDIRLRPDLKNFTFEGIETITLNVLKKSRTLTLHSKELEIETASVSAVSAKVGLWRVRQSPTLAIFGKITYDQKSDTTTFLFSKAIPAGRHKLTLVFKGILNDKMRGFYRSKYMNLDVEHHMATTQFEATDARRAFPCFDEPAQKAIFNVSLVVPAGKTAISNTLPVSVEEHEEGYQIVKFSPTPKMSTYLLAFIIGDFEYVEGKTKRGVQVRVFTTPGKKHQAGFALSCAIKTLEFYEDYFQIPYPLPVLDMIAIPDFTSAAMENWGAITYREAVLLVDEKHSSASNKQWVALVIAHELAHQWFGNLVTMEWWTHLWLNEGFASYIEYLAVDKIFPHWDIWTQFTTNDLGVALRLDSLLSTHPIEIPVHHPDEIGEIFDEVSYSKGASVICMLAEYLGKKNFRNGLRYYLKKHSYKNTETIHLWKALERISKKPVEKFMKNWTGKSGYPVVKVKMRNGKFTWSQERFFASPISKSRAKDKTKWQIPLAVKENKGWLKVNMGESGFFRTAYSKELLDKLREPVRKKLITPRDRLGIIRDLFALSEGGIIPTTDALEFLRSYKNEDNYTVWVEIATGLARLEQITARTTLAVKLDKLTLELFSPLVDHLGWQPKKDERYADTLLRSIAISRAGKSGNRKVIKEARARFTTIKNGKHISPDIRGAVYSVVATWGGVKEYKTFLDMYKKENLHEEKNRFGNALGDFQDEKLLNNTCDFALSDDVRIQDTIGILTSIGVNSLGRDVWLHFITKNWKVLVSRYGEGGHTLARLVKAIGGSAEEKHLRKFRNFFSSHDAPGAKRSIEQVLERLEGNIAWLERDKKTIEKFLK